MNFSFFSGLGLCIFSFILRKKELKMLQSQIECGKILVKDGWLMCPRCKRGKVLRVTEETVARNLPVFCRRCCQESIVNIERLSPCRKPTSA